MSADWLDDVSSTGHVPAASNEVKAIALKVKELADLQQQEEQLESLLKNVKEQIRVLEQDIIPEMLNRNEISAIRVPGVGEVSTELAYKASVSAENWNRFKAWAHAHGYEDVVKERLEVINPTPELISAARETSNDFAISSAVPWQTMAKLARTIAANGDDFPDTLSVFKYYKTKINAKKA